MTQHLDDTSVTVSTDVAAPLEHAFTVFTEGIGTWWNPSHHLLQGELAEMVFEPRVGGHIYDRMADGRENHWARVLAYDPPTRVVFSWDINPQWQLETDPARSSEVEVTFTALSTQTTRVHLVHRHLDRHGDGWEAVRAGVGSGWNLDTYAKTAAQR